jgi:hypothetical protein
MRLSGGRSWWAHFKFTRINIELIFLRKKIEEQLALTALSFARRSLRPWEYREAGGSCTERDGPSDGRVDRATIRHGRFGRPAASIYQSWASAREPWDRDSGRAARPPRSAVDGSSDSRGLSSRSRNLFLADCTTPIVMIRSPHDDAAE